MTYEHQKKQRNALLKQKAKLLKGGPTKQSNGAKVLFDYDAAMEKEHTFVTGGGLPGRKRDGGESSDEDKFYLNDEDELLEQVEKHERDMNDMLKYLNEVEDMMGGNDLAQIRKMMKYSNDTMEQHKVAYDKIKTNVDGMNKSALEAMKSISEYAPEVKGLIKESEKR